jgi:hypothetical protein
MANYCPTVPVELIKETEYIGDSLTKINENFESLRQGACLAENLLENIVSVRTFFYYGPNAPVNITVGANDYSNDNAASRPSNATIETFVNSTSGLNLNPISEPGDITYVIYQKTGWYSGQSDFVRSGKGTVPYTYSYTVTYPVYRKIGIAHGKGKTVLVGWVTETKYATAYAGYSWSRNLSDQYNYYSPSYIIYKLVYNGAQYNAVTDSSWPKFVRSQTGSIINWNNPKSWSTY